MIETLPKLNARLLAAAVLSLAAACNVSASGQIPCVDDSSCPADYPVCSSGKCVTGTSTSALSVAIVGVQGHGTTDILRGSVTVAVAARAGAGVKSVALTGGGKTYQPNSSSAPPLYYFDVPTTDFTNGDISLGATVTAGNGTTASSPAFTVHVNNQLPTLTTALVGSANVADGTMVRFDVTTSEAVSSISGSVSGTGSGALSEISTGSGLVHHFGYAITSADAEGSHDVTFTATDLAGNSGSSTSVAAFNVRHPFTFASLAASTSIGAVGGVTAAKKDTVVTVTATLPNRVTFASGAAPVFKLTSAGGGTVRTLPAPTRTAGSPNDTWTATYTVVSADHDGLATVSADATDVAGNAPVTNTASLLIDETAPVLTNLTVTPQYADIVHNPVAFAGAAAEPLQTVTISTNNGDTGTCKCDGLANCAADTSQHPLITCLVHVTNAATTSLVSVTATITATDLVGNAFGSVSGYGVVPPPVGLTLLPATRNLTLGQSATLTAHFTGGTGMVSGSDGSNNGVADLGSVAVAPTTDTTYQLLVTNAATTTDTTVTASVHVVPAPVITSFGASPTVISSGSSSTLTAVFDAGPGGTATIDNSVGAVVTTVGKSISPTVTTTYVLTVTNAAGSQVQASATVNVGAIPVLSFTKSAGSIFPGATSDLTANVSNAVSASIDPGAVNVPTDGVNHITTVAPTVTTTYTLTAVNSAGLASHLTQTVTVTPATVTSFLATASPINAGAAPQVTPTFGPAGSTAVISLSTDNAARPCGTTIVTGTPISCAVINEDTTYLLTVTAGTSTDLAAVSVKATPAAITSFNAASATVNAGAAPQVTPIWTPTTGSPAAVVTVSDGSGAPPCGSSFTSGTPVTCAAINQNTVYTLTVTQGTTVATKTMTVKVNPFISSWRAVAPTLGFAGAAPSLIPVFGPPNATGAITLVTGGASACGGTATSGSAASCAPISATTAYRLTVNANGGTPVTMDVTVTVADNPSTGINLTSNANPVTKANSSTSNNFKLTPTYCATCTATLFDGTTTTPAPASTVQTGNKTITATTVFTLTATNAAGESATFDLTETLLPGSFAPTTAVMAARRFGATVTLLPSGKVLIAGGRTTQGTVGTAVKSAEVYYPSDNSFHALAALCCSSTTMKDERYQASAVLLPNGLVLISGGSKTDGSVVTSQDWYDPAQDGFLTAGPGAMAVGRMGHTATLMFDNTVFFYGGSSDGTNANALTSGEVYTDGSGANAVVLTGSFAGTAPLARYRHTATLLPDSRLLLAGGILAAGTTPTKVDIIGKSGAILTGAQPAGLLQVARSGGHAAVRLADSRILLVGGTATTPLAEIGTISGATASFVAATGPLSTARCNVAAVGLPSGNVLVAGGTNCSTATGLQSAEVFNFTSNSFNPTATPTAARQEQGATFLFNGTALITGGDSAAATAETYNPN